MKLLIVIIFLIIIVFVYFYFKLRNNQKNKKINNDEIALVKNDTNYFPSIQIIETKNNIPSEKNKIVNKDIKNILMKIDNIVPNSIIMNNNIKTGVELINNNKAFFSAVKKGTENMLQADKSGKVYGIQMRKDSLTNRMLFDKQTKFTKEDALVNIAGDNALINAGFNAASMIVGQYYMSEINNKLENIEENISEISNYLDTEYKGKLMYIVSKLKEIIDNKYEILNNEFSKNKRYDEIINLESECAKLLGQANNEIKENMPNKNSDYKNYEKKLEIISKWFERQQLLQRLLLEIGDLRYVLASGNETAKISHTQYNNYLEQSNSIIEQLKKIHIYMSKKFGIDIKESRMNGRFYKIRKNTLGKIKEDWAYHKLDDNIIKMIEKQTNVKEMNQYTKDKQDEVIKIQKYDGEYYNLLE